MNESELDMATDSFLNDEEQNTTTETADQIEDKGRKDASKALADSQQKIAENSPSYQPNTPVSEPHPVQSNPAPDFSEDGIINKFASGADYSRDELGMMDADQRQRYDEIKVLWNEEKKSQEERRKEAVNNLEKGLTEAEDLYRMSKFITEHTKDNDAFKDDFEYASEAEKLFGISPLRYAKLDDESKQLIRDDVLKLYDKTNKFRGHLETAVDGFKRGYVSAGNMLYQGGIALQPGSLDKEDVRLIEGSIRSGKLSDLENPQKIGGVENIHSVGDALDWFLEGVGENATRGLAATGIATTGAMLAPLVGASAGVGSIVFGSLGTMAMNTGEAVQDQIDEGNDISKTRGWAIAQGTGYSILDGAFGINAWGAKLWSGMLSKVGVKSAVKGLSVDALEDVAKWATVKGVAKKVGGAMLEEGVQETAQSQGVGRFVRWLQTGTPFKKDESVGDAFLEAVNEFAGGAALGFGGALVHSVPARVGAKKTVDAYNRVMDILNNDKDYQKLDEYGQLLVKRHLVNDSMLATEGVISQKILDSLAKNNTEIEAELNRLSELQGEKNAGLRLVGQSAKAYLSVFKSQYALENIASVVNSESAKGFVSRIDEKSMYESGRPIIGENGKQTAIVYVDKMTGISIAQLMDENGNPTNKFVFNNDQSRKSPIFGKNELVCGSVSEAIDRAKELDVYNQWRDKKLAQKKAVLEQVVNKMFGDKGVKLNLVDRASPGCSLNSGETAAYNISDNSIDISIDDISSLGQLYTVLAHEKSHKDIVDFLKKSGEFTDKVTGKINWGALEAARQELYSKVAGAELVSALNRGKDATAVGIEYTKDGEKKTRTEYSNAKNAWGTSAGVAGEEMVAEVNSVYNLAKQIRDADKGFVGWVGDKIRSIIGTKMALDMGITPEQVSGKDVTIELNQILESGLLGDGAPAFAAAERKEKMKGMAPGGNKTTADFVRGYGKPASPSVSAGDELRMGAENLSEEKPQSKKTEQKKDSKPKGSLKPKMKNGDGKAFPASTAIRRADGRSFVKNENEDGSYSWADIVDGGAVDDETASDGGYIVSFSPAQKKTAETKTEAKPEETKDKKPSSVENKAEQKSEEKSSEKPIEQNAAKTEEKTEEKKTEEKKEVVKEEAKPVETAEEKKEEKQDTKSSEPVMANPDNDTVSVPQDEKKLETPRKTMAPRTKTSVAKESGLSANAITKEVEDKWIALNELPVGAKVKVGTKVYTKGGKLAGKTDSFWMDSSKRKITQISLSRLGDVVIVDAAPKASTKAKVSANEQKKAGKNTQSASKKTVSAEKIKAEANKMIASDAPFANDAQKAKAVELASSEGGLLQVKESQLAPGYAVIRTGAGIRFIDTNGSVLSDAEVAELQAEAARQKLEAEVKAEEKPAKVSADDRKSVEAGVKSVIPDASSEFVKKVSDLANGNLKALVPVPKLNGVYLVKTGDGRTVGIDKNGDELSQSDIVALKSGVRGKSSMTRILSVMERVSAIRKVYGKQSFVSAAVEAAGGVPSDYKQLSDDRLLEKFAKNYDGVAYAELLDRFITNPPARLNGGLMRLFRENGATTHEMAVKCAKVFGRLVKSVMEASDSMMTTAKANRFATENTAAVEGNRSVSASRAASLVKTLANAVFGGGDTDSRMADLVDKTYAAIKDYVYAVENSKVSPERILFLDDNDFDNLFAVEQILAKRKESLKKKDLAGDAIASDRLVSACTMLLDAIAKYETIPGMDPELQKDLDAIRKGEHISPKYDAAAKALAYSKALARRAESLGKKGSDATDDSLVSAIAEYIRHYTGMSTRLSAAPIYSLADAGLVDAKQWLAKDFATLAKRYALRDAFSGLQGYYSESELKDISELERAIYDRTVALKNLGKTTEEINSDDIISAYRGALATFNDAISRFGNDPEISSLVRSLQTEAARGEEESVGDTPLGTKISAEQFMYTLAHRALNEVKAEEDEKASKAKAAEDARLALEREKERQAKQDEQDTWDALEQDVDVEEIRKARRLGSIISIDKKYMEMSDVELAKLCIKDGDRPADPDARQAMKARLYFSKDLIEAIYNKYKLAQLHTADVSDVIRRIEKVFEGEWDREYAKIPDFWKGIGAGSVIIRARRILTNLVDEDKKIAAERKTNSLDTMIAERGSSAEMDMQHALESDDERASGTPDFSERGNGRAWRLEEGLFGSAYDAMNYIIKECPLSKTQRQVLKELIEAMDQVVLSSYLNVEAEKLRPTGNKNRYNSLMEKYLASMKLDIDDSAIIDIAARKCGMLPKIYRAHLMMLMDDIESGFLDEKVFKYVKGERDEETANLTVEPNQDALTEQQKRYIRRLARGEFDAAHAFRATKGIASKRLSDKVGKEAVELIKFMNMNDDQMMAFVVGLAEQGMKDSEIDKKLLKANADGLHSFSKVRTLPALLDKAYTDYGWIDTRMLSGEDAKKRPLVLKQQMRTVLQKLIRRFAGEDLSDDNIRNNVRPKVRNWLKVNKVDTRDGVWLANIVVSAVSAERGNLPVTKKEKAAAYRALVEYDYKTIAKMLEENGNDQEKVMSILKSDIETSGRAESMFTHYNSQVNKLATAAEVAKLREQRRAEAEAEKEKKDRELRESMKEKEMTEEERALALPYDTKVEVLRGMAEELADNSATKEKVLRFSDKEITDFAKDKLGFSQEMADFILDQLRPKATLMTDGDLKNHSEKVKWGISEDRMIADKLLTASSDVAEAKAAVDKLTEKQIADYDRAKKFIEKYGKDKALEKIAEQGASEAVVNRIRHNAGLVAVARNTLKAAEEKLALLKLKPEEKVAKLAEMAAKTGDEFVDDEKLRNYGIINLGMTMKDADSAVSNLRPGFGKRAKSTAVNGVAEYDIMARREDESSQQYAKRIAAYYPKAFSTEGKIALGILEGYVGRRGDEPPAKSQGLASFIGTSAGGRSTRADIGKVRNVAGKAYVALPFGESKFDFADSLIRYITSKEALAGDRDRFRIAGISIDGDLAIADIEYDKNLRPSSDSARDKLKARRYEVLSGQEYTGETNEFAMQSPGHRFAFGELPLVFTVDRGPDTVMIGGTVADTMWTKVRDENMARKAGNTVNDYTQDDLFGADFGRRAKTSGIYTGSAADYDKPSLVHVGTGEGSQVYGWGLYGSNRRGVAENYARRAEPGVDFTRYNVMFEGKSLEDLAKEYREEKENIAIFGGTEEEKKDLYEKDLVVSALGYIVSEYVPSVSFAIWKLKSYNPYGEERTKEIVNFLKKNIDKITLPYLGKIYEQTFFTNRPEGDESHLLMWYEKISAENSKRINDQLEKEGLYVRGIIPLREETIELDGFPPVVLKFPTGERVYDMLVSSLGTPKAASEFLVRADIDGIKYPVNSYKKSVKDGDKAGWNYVSFRDDNITIDHKWVNGMRRFQSQDVVTPYTMASDEDPNYQFNTQRSLRDTHGLTDYNGRPTKKDEELLEEARDLLSRKDDYANMITRARDGQPITDTDVRALGLDISDRMASTLSKSLTDQELAANEEKLDILTEALLKGTSAAGAALNAAKFGVDLRTRDTHVYLKAMLKARLEKEAEDMQGPSGPDALAKDIQDKIAEYEKRISEQAEELKKAHDTIDEQKAKISKLEREADDKALGRIAKESAEAYNRGFAEGQRVADEAERARREEEAKSLVSEGFIAEYIDSLMAGDTILDGIFGGRSAGRPDLGLSNHVRAAFAAILRAAGDDEQKARAHLAKRSNYESDIKPLFDKFMSEIKKESAPSDGSNKTRKTNRKRVIEKAAEPVEDMARKANPEEVERLVEEAVNEAEANETSMDDDLFGDEKDKKSDRKLPYIIARWADRAGKASANADSATDLELAKRYIGEYARNIFKISTAIRPEETISDKLKEIARRMSAALKGVPFDENDARDAILGRGDFKPITRKDAAATYEQLKKAKELAQAGNLFEAAKTAGIKFASDSDIIEELDRRLGRILDKKLNVWESRANEERNEDLARQIQDLIRAIQDVRSGKPLAYLLDKYLTIAVGMKDYRRQRSVLERIQSRIDMYEKKLANNDFEPTPPRETPDVSNELKEISIAMRKLERLRERYRKERDAWRLKKTSWLRKNVSSILELLGEVKAVAGSLDLSSMLRQGGQMTWAHPLIFAKNFGRTMKALKSEEAAEQMFEEIWSRPNAKYYKIAGIDFTDWGENAANADDRFVLNQYRKFTNNWLIKKGIRMSERAFSMYLNLMRADLFDAMVRNSTFRDASQMTGEQLKAIGNYINIASQRGTIDRQSNMGKALQAMNAVLWSPRNIISRFHFIAETLMLPLHGISRSYGADANDIELRKMFAKETGRYILGVVSAIAFAKMLADLFRGDDEPPEDMVWDLRSSDFGKVKFGNTRIDFMSGLQQIFVFSTRALTHKTKNLRGEVKELSNPADYYALFMRFARSKFSPAASFIWDTAIARETYDRQDVSWSLKDQLKNDKEVVGVSRYFAENLFVPLSIRDLKEQFDNTDLSFAPVSWALTVLGAGVQAFDPYTYKQLSADYKYFKGLYDNAATNEERDDLVTRHPMLKRAGSIGPQLKYVNKLKRDIKKATEAGVKDVSALEDILERETKRAINLMAGFSKPMDVD